LEDEERRKAVADALERLPLEDRTVVVLRDLDDKPYEEISLALRIPLGTVKSRLARARGKLQEMLKDAL
jgi:RNA polymerase sigma-70 factor (ECF subfamily)